MTPTDIDIETSYATLLQELQRAHAVIDKLQAEIQSNNLHDRIEWPHLFQSSRLQALIGAAQHNFERATRPIC